MFNFDLLKRIFYILLFIVGFYFSGSAQLRPSTSAAFAVKTVKFYPNPAASFINFEFSKSYDQSYSLQIYNFIGKKVVDIKANEKKVTIPLTDFYRGIYIFQVKDYQGSIVEAGKFQVIK